MGYREVRNKYSEIFETLRKDICNGKFEVPGALPSEHALMRRFAVARGTVRRAIDELRKHNLLSSRQGAMSVLSFRARERAAGTFGLIVPDAYYPFYSRISAGIERFAKRTKEGGFSLLSADLGSGERSFQASRALEFAEVCVREKVCGVFFQPILLMKESERINRMILSLFDKADIPVVLLDSDIFPPPRRSKYDLVGVDNIAIGYELGRLVIKRGARRVIYFSNPYSAQTSLLRGYGVSLAATEAGLSWNDENAFFADPTDVSAAKRLFAGKKRPDAIVAVNDYVADLILKTLKQIGKRVPADVLLAGVNGDPISEESDPPITTAVQPCERIGEAAVQLMLQRIADPGMPPREVHFTAPVTERASTRRRKRA